MAAIEYQTFSTERGDFRRLAAAVVVRWRLVLGIGVACFAVVATATALSPLEFSATSRLYLGELETRRASSEDEVDIGAASTSDVGSEVEIMRSRSILTKAVLTSGANTRLTLADSKPLNYWRWRVSGRDMTLLDAATRKVKATQTDVTDQSPSSRKFRVTFITPDTYELDSGAPGAIIATGKLDRPLLTEGVSVTLTRSGTSNGNLAAGDGELAPGDAFMLEITPSSRAVDSVLERLAITVPKSSGNTKPNIVALSFTDSSPGHAVGMLTAVMDAYLQERLDWKVQNASAAETFVTSQLSNLRTSLDKSRKALADFRASNRVVVLDSEAQAMIGQISKFEEQRVASRLEASALADVERALKDPTSAPEAFMLGEAQDTVLASLSASLSEARRKLSELESRFSPEAPDVVNQRAQVQSQLSTIKSYVSNRLGRARENLGALSGVIGNYEKKLKTVPGAELELAQLTREAEVYETMYTFLLKRQQQAAITKASTVSRNRILDKAEMPFQESNPQLGLRLASGPIGLVLGVLCALLGSIFSRTFRSSSDIYEVLRGSPVFATLPQALPANRRLRAANQRTLDSLRQQVSFAFLEAFRTLRTNLYLLAPPHMGVGKVVLVTSAARGDGKTTSALSLAWVLAADSKRVLVIDADLRKPSIYQLSGEDKVTPNTPPKDLRSVLSGECSWKDAAVAIPGARELYALGVTERTPAELLSTHNLRLALSQAQRDCDYIIIDAPSFPLVSDALVIGPVADLAISVIRPEHTPRGLAQEHVSRMKEVTKAHAVIINDSRKQDSYADAYSGVAQLSQPAA
jgi:tyrosine-protein kinase Etk/Wzc